MDPLRNLIPWIAASGILGLLGVAFIEGLVPILPSTALLVGLGVAVAEGHGSLHVALWSSTAGLFLALRCGTGAWRGDLLGSAQANRPVSRRFGSAARAPDCLFSSP